MKKKILSALSVSLILFACNNEPKDTVEKADSINEVKMDSPAVKQPIQTDEESTNFLVKAANGGMTEVAAAKIAQEKATNPEVKKFADMMVMDHGEANSKAKALAAERNVTLPAAPSDDMKKELDELQNKSAKDFDKAYVKAMVKGHEMTLDMFKKASDKVNDAAVKGFIDNTIPTIQKHLDTIKDLEKKMK